MLTLPLPADAGEDYKPEPCPHIDWGTYTQYATWSTGPSGVSSDEIEQRRADVGRQDLAFADDPHLCYSDGDVYVWAVALA